MQYWLAAMEMEMEMDKWLWHGSIWQLLIILFLLVLFTLSISYFK